MKIILAALLALLMVLLLAACTDKNSNSKTSSSSSSDTASSSKPELSSSEIESIVAQILYTRIGSHFHNVDPGSCTYNINKTEKVGRYYYAYGSLTLYDKYGKLTSGSLFGSGSAFHTFTVKIEDTGKVSSCEFDK